MLRCNSYIFPFRLLRFRSNISWRPWFGLWFCLGLPWRFLWWFILLYTSPWVTPRRDLMHVTGTESGNALNLWCTDSEISSNKYRFLYVSALMIYANKIVAAFQGMHVSPAIHSFAWLSRKCDYRTYRQTDTQTDAGQNDLYVLLCFPGDTIMTRYSLFYFPYIFNSKIYSQWQPHRDPVPLWPWPFDLFNPKFNSCFPLFILYLSMRYPH